MVVTQYSPLPPILGDQYITILIVISGILGLIFALYQFMKIRKIKIYNNELYNELNNNSWDRDTLINVYEAISEGAAEFLRQEFFYMYIFIAVFATIITLLVGTPNNCGSLVINNGIVHFTPNDYAKTIHE